MEDRSGADGQIDGRTPLFLFLQIGVVGSFARSFGTQKSRIKFSPLSLSLSLFFSLVLPSFSAARTALGRRDSDSSSPPEAVRRHSERASERRSRSRRRRRCARCGHKDLSQSLSRTYRRTRTKTGGREGGRGHTTCRRCRRHCQLPWLAAGRDIVMKHGLLSQTGVPCFAWVSGSVDARITRRGVPNQCMRWIHIEEGLNF